MAVRGDRWGARAVHMLVGSHKYSSTALYMCVSLNVYSPFDQDVSLPIVTAGVCVVVCVIGGGGHGVGLYCRPRDQSNQCVFKGKKHILQRGAAHCNDVDSSLIRVYTSDSTRGRLALVRAFLQGVCVISKVTGSCGEIYSAGSHCFFSLTQCIWEQTRVK